MIEKKLKAIKIGGYRFSIDHADEILEFTNFEAFPEVGQLSKFYFNQAENKMYRWNGAGYEFFTGVIDGGTF
jgi:hypothetical protein